MPQERPAGLAGRLCDSYKGDQHSFHCDGSTCRRDFEASAPTEHLRKHCREREGRAPTRVDGKGVGLRVHTVKWAWISNFDAVFLQDCLDPSFRPKSGVCGKFWLSGVTAAHTVSHSTGVNEHPFPHRRRPMTLVRLCLTTSYGFSPHGGAGTACTAGLAISMCITSRALCCASSCRSPRREAKRCTSSLRKITCMYMHDHPYALTHTATMKQKRETPRAFG